MITVGNEKGEELIFLPTAGRSAGLQQQQHTLCYLILIVLFSFQYFASPVTCICIFKVHGNENQGIDKEYVVKRNNGSLS